MPSRSPSRVLLFLLLVAAAAGGARAEGIAPLWLGDDQLKIRPSMALQLQGAAILDDEGLRTDAFIRRTRLKLQTRALEGRVGSMIHVEVTPTKPELIDLFIDVQPVEQVKVRVGQFKTPFTQYFQYSLTELAIDWPITSKWYGGERQLGVMASGALPFGFGYASGVFAGDNRRATFSTALAALYGESAANPSALATVTEVPELGDLHPELVMRLFHRGSQGGGHEADGMNVRRPIDREGGGPRHHLGLSLSWDTDAVPRRDWAVRLAPEAIVKWQGLSLHAVAFFAAFVDRRDQLLPGSVGGLAELGYRPHRMLEVTGRLARAQVLPALDEDAKRSGAASGRLAQTEVAAGLHVLLLGRSLVWQHDLALLNDAGRGGSSTRWRARTQLQLAF